LPAQCIALSQPEGIADARNAKTDRVPIGLPF
jgi:hypothetical protein